MSDSIQMNQRRRVQALDNNSQQSNNNSNKNPNRESKIIDIFNEIKSSSKLMTAIYPKNEIRIMNDEVSPFSFVDPQIKTEFTKEEADYANDNDEVENEDDGNDSKLDNELIELKEKDKQRDIAFNEEIAKQNAIEIKRKLERKTELERQRVAAKQKGIETEEQRSQTEIKEKRLRELSSLRIQREIELERLIELRKQAEMIIQQNKEEEDKDINNNGNVKGDLLKEKQQEIERQIEYERQEKAKRQLEAKQNYDEEIEREKEYKREIEKIINTHNRLDREIFNQKGKDAERQKEYKQLLDKQTEQERDDKELIEYQRQIEEEKEIERQTDIEAQREMERIEELKRQNEIKRLREEEEETNQKEIQGIQEKERQEELERLNEIEKQKELNRLQEIEIEKEKEESAKQNALKDIEEAKEFNDKSLHSLNNNSKLNHSDIDNKQNNIDKLAKENKDIIFADDDTFRKNEIAPESMIDTHKLPDVNVDDNKEIALEREDYNKEETAKKPKHQKKKTQSSDLWDTFQWERDPANVKQIAKSTQIDSFKNISIVNPQIGLTTSTQINPHENNNDNKNKNSNNKADELANVCESKLEYEAEQSDINQPKANEDMFSHNKNIFNTMNFFNFDQDIPDPNKEGEKIRLNDEKEVNTNQENSINKEKEKVIEKDTKEKKDNAEDIQKEKTKEINKDKQNENKAIINESIVPSKTSKSIPKQKKKKEINKDIDTKAIIDTYDPDADIYINNNNNNNNANAVNDIDLQFEFDDNNEANNHPAASIQKEKTINKKQTKESQLNPNKDIKPQQSKQSQIKHTNTLIDQITNEISAINTKEPELNDNLPLIESFTTKEPSLQTEIPSLDKDILNQEGRDIFLSRRTGFLNKKSFESSIAINTSLLEQLQNCKETYEQKMQTNMKQSSIDLFSLSKSNLADSFFNKQSSSIGSIDNMTSFFYKYSTYTLKALMEKYIKNYDKWRSIRSDGNSFYRVFMFSLIEEYICHNHLNELTLIIHEIHIRVSKEPTLSILKRKNVNPSDTLLLLKKILSLLMDGNQSKAYELLIKGYQLANQSFDYVLIAYLRGVLYEYVIELHSLAKIEGERNSQVLNIRQKESIESICYYGIEANFFLICVSSYLFNVNIELMWIDGEYSKPKYDIIKIEDNNKIELPCITIGFVYSNYIKLYPKTLEEETMDIIAIKHSNKSIEKLTYVQKNTEDMMECIKCSKVGPIVFFMQRKFSVCLACLKAHIDIIFTNRAHCYIKENFLSLEYYTNDIPVYEHYTITQYEYMELYNGENIAKGLNDKIALMCFSCGERVNKTEESYILNCKCQYCSTCLRKKVETVFQKFRALNIYEKRK